MRAHIRFFQPVFNLLLGLDGSSLALTTLGGGGPDGSGTPPQELQVAQKVGVVEVVALKGT